MNRWSQSELELLGTMPDRSVAEKIGRSIWCVSVQRRKRGIPRYVDHNEKRPWSRAEESLLGTKPDAQLAQHLRCAMTNSENDPDAAALAQRYPGLRQIGERVKIESGPRAGEPTIIRRRLTERDSVLFTLKYDDGRILEWEWWD